jgi:PAS domain S-box-containing protein
LKKTRKARVEEVIRTKRPVEFIDERKGIIFDNNLYPLFDSYGNVIKIAIFGRDITKQQQIEQELKESEARYRFIFEQGPVGIGLIDMDYFWIKANPRFCEMLGYTEEELKTFRWNDITHPDDLEGDIQQAEQVFKGEIPFFTTEKRFFKKNGEIIWVSLTPTAIKDNNGKILYALGMMLDITEKKIAEDNMHKAYSQIKNLKDQLNIENIYLKEEIESIQGFENIIGNSLPLNYVLQRLKSVAPTDATVLVEGETGTGKELIARALHNGSLRKTKPMIKVGCAALSSSLIESELFGHEKGAFTGANTTRIGRFELANGSTIFLDEIGELSFKLQAKLLRIIQEGEFERLGSSKTIKVDVRIITATNRNLEAEVRKGRFREDLYYRLSTFVITVPPLRERKDDIRLLVNSFLDQYGKKMGKRIKSIPRSTMKNLEKYSWPGNIRELQNVIEQAIIISDNGVLKIELPALSGTHQKDKLKLEDVERDHILNVLKKTNWRLAGKGGAAELLGLKRTTLQSRIKKLGIEIKKANT